MQQIILNLDQTDNKLYHQNLIRQGENLASELVINLSTEFQGYKYLIKFKNNENLEVITQELIPIENQIKYAITNPLTKDAGTLRIELNAFDDTGMLKKTATTTLRVLDALGETDEVVPEAFAPWYIHVFDLVENFTTEEAARVEAENLRNSAEQDRDGLYQQAEGNRDSQYAQAEADRNTTYGARVTAVETDLSTHTSAYTNKVISIDKEIYDIQRYLGKFEVKSWAEVQEIVRQGNASKYFKVGDQFIANYNSVPFTWDIIGIDHDKPTDTSKEHSLTLQAHDCIMNCQFDAPEALYYAETELAAGTHIFTLNALQYTFTTTKAVPAGGQIFVSDWGEGSYIPTKIATYAANRATAIETDLDVTATTGTDTLAAVNNHSRCRYGSNNYMESAIKQFLNSNATSFAWTPKTNFDIPPSGAPYTDGGFLKLLDPELVAVLGAVDKQVARNTLTDGGGQDLFSDKVFLLSTKEVYGTNEGVITGEDAYPYYSVLAGAATNDVLEGRIKYLAGSARSWWLRSPFMTHSYTPRCVSATGNFSGNYASLVSGLVPACCIV